MIFLLNKKDKEELVKLFETREYNINVNKYLNENVINHSLTNEDKNEYRISKLNIDEYTNNEYFKNIKVKEISKNDLKIKYEIMSENNCFLYDEANIDKEDYYVAKNKIGYFSEEYNFLSIQKDNVTWMSIVPHEVNTMKNIINKADKDIYVLGLGLGYFAYLSSIKSNVSSITIVDNDSQLVNLFKENIFPTFIEKQKYKLIIDDAFNYLKNISKDKFIFIDLWHNELDGLLTYIKLKKQLRDYSNVYYWIENSLINAFRNLLIILMEEEFYKVDAQYINASNDNDLIINSLHKYLLNKEFKSYTEIKNFLDSDNLRSLIINLNI